MLERERDRCEGKVQHVDKAAEHYSSTCMCTRTTRKTSEGFSQCLDMYSWFRIHRSVMLFRYALSRHARYSKSEQKRANDAHD